MYRAITRINRTYCARFVNACAELILIGYILSEDPHTFIVLIKTVHFVLAIDYGSTLIHNTSLHLQR